MAVKSVAMKSDQTAHGAKMAARPNRNTACDQGLLPLSLMADPLNKQVDPGDRFLTPTDSFNAVGDVPSAVKHFVSVFRLSEEVASLHKVPQCTTYGRVASWEIGHGEYPQVA